MENTLQDLKSNTPSPTKGIAIYLRVSTEKQDSNTSKDTQFNTIKMKIKELALENRVTFIYEDTESASKKPISSNFEDDSFSSRKGLNELIFDAKLGKFDTLFVYSHDRLTRNVHESLLLKYLFKKLNIDVVYCRPGEDLNTQNQKINEFFDHLLNNIAQLEANLIGARVKLGNEYKIKNNLWAGGPPPYGYKLNKGPKGRTTLKVSAIEAAIVKEIFNLYLSGCSPKIIAELIREKYPENNDRKWTVNSIKSIISNESYLGYIVWNKKGGARNPVKHTNPIKSSKITENEIISNEIWEEVKKIKSLIRNNPKFLSTPFLLKDFLVCGDCGKKLKCKNNGKGKKRVYYCDNDKGKWDFCIDAKEIEEKIISKINERITDLLSDEKHYDEFYNAYVKKHEEKIGLLKKQREELYEEYKSVIAELENCEKEIFELTQTKHDVDMEKDKTQYVLLDSLKEFKSFLCINKEIIEKKLERNAEKQREPLISKEKFKEKINKDTKLLDSISKKLDSNIYKRYIRILLLNTIEKIIITHDKNVEIISLYFS
ncbi:recombinase family protein [Caloramator australicus]|nr:recombinase family protein [Caloramator australicus]